MDPEVVPMRSKDALGRFGEDLAAARLTEAGLRVLARNWRCPTGEIDIVARDGDCLVICEVKTRRTNKYGTPAEAVGQRKVRRLRELALHWLDAQEIYVPEIRFDVVSVIVPPEGRPVVEHMVGVA